MKNTQHWNFKEARWDSEKVYQAGDLEDYLQEDHNFIKSVKSAIVRAYNNVKLRKVSLPK